MSDAPGRLAQGNNRSAPAPGTRRANPTTLLSNIFARCTMTNTTTKLKYFDHEKWWESAQFAPRLKKMLTDRDVQNEVYRLVADELSRNEISPGVMARAVADSRGNTELTRSLYIKYRFEELCRKAALGDAAITCPRCGHVGPLFKAPKGDWGVLLALLMLLVVPGVIYAIACAGYKRVCSKCGRTLGSDFSS